MYSFISNISEKVLQYCSNILNYITNVDIIAIIITEFIIYSDVEIFNFIQIYFNFNLL